MDVPDLRVAGLIRLNLNLVARSSPSMEVRSIDGPE
jgi:hypothetical protein